MRTVDDAINQIIDEEEEYIKRDGFIFIRIQEIAKKMHRHYWKYRDKILEKIQEWARGHPSRSIWIDAKGRKYRVGYGDQMSFAYGSFFEGKFIEKSVNMLELYLEKERDGRG